MLLTKIAGQTDTRAIGGKKRTRSYKSSSFFRNYLAKRSTVGVLVFSFFHYMTLLLLLLVYIFLFPRTQFPAYIPPPLGFAFNFKSGFAAAKTQGFPPNEV